jgi:hypothetical protein
MPIRQELDTIADLEAGARAVPAGAELYRQGERSAALPANSI